VTYGSDKSVDLATDLAETLKTTSYRTSAILAKERGCFPLYQSTLIGSYYPSWLNDSLRSTILDYGLRNGVLNTVAPNGTISMYVGNVSSGIEPIFSTQKVERKVLQPDGSHKIYKSVDYAQRLYEAMFPGGTLPESFVGAHDVHPLDHIRVQAAWQKHVDSSISKTVNCSTDMPFEEFEGVYLAAYESGCKGCTTYRYDPAAGRGSVLSEVDDKPIVSVTNLSGETVTLNLNQYGEAVVTEETFDNVRPRPDIVPGNTHKVKWPTTGDNIYITVTNVDGEPLELFIKHQDSSIGEWTDALSRMVTGVMRRGGDLRFIVDQLSKVGSTSGGAFVDGVYRPSVVAAIAGVVEKEFKSLGVYERAIGMPIGNNKNDEAEPTAEALQAKDATERKDEHVSVANGAPCPNCKQPFLRRESGCDSCALCGYLRCG